MIRSVRELEKMLPVRAEADVIVAGGGLGGVAAAIAAARSGARTLLVERNSYPGGVATAGMCCSIFNCFYTRNKVLGSHGIAVEIADALAEAEGYGSRWHRHKGHIIYDIEQAKYVLTEKLLSAGVRIFLETSIAGVVMEKDRLKGLILESKSGREAVMAKTFVDATGDADVAALAGAPLRSAERGIHSLCFRFGNVDVDRFVGFFREHPEQYPEFMDVEWTFDEALQQYDDCGTFLFPHGGGMQMEPFARAKANGDLPSSVGIHDTTDACQMHALRDKGIVHVVTGFVHFDGIDIEKITQSITDGRKMAFAVADVYRKYIPGFDRAVIIGTADNLGVRASRYIDGDFIFTAPMMEGGHRFPDSVGRAVGWDHPVMHHGKNAWAAQALRADTFDIPYRALLPRSVEGLVMGAGRSASCENPFSLRVMVHTMVLGQGAGVAAAMAARTGVDPRGVDIGLVQTELRKQGVPT